MPQFVQRLFPKRVWTFPKNKNSVYLTFDDGPVPQVTPWVLDQLKNHHAKATFFCIGDNINKFPEIVDRIISEGHTIGNHTYNHLNGWKTKTDDYIVNCEMFDKILNNLETLGQESKSKITNQKPFFRPPFEKLTSKQSKILQKKGYKIIMWDVLSADFDNQITKENCLNNVLKNLQNGSIMVFHDSLKAENKLRYVLPKVLENIKMGGFECKSIRY